MFDSEADRFDFMRLRGSIRGRIGSGIGGANLFVTGNCMEAASLLGNMM